MAFAIIRKVKLDYKIIAFKDSATWRYAMAGLMGKK
jgi:hypothetical protein